MVYMERKVKIVIISVISVLFLTITASFFLLKYLWYIDHRSMPKTTAQIPYSCGEYSKEFDSSIISENGVYRWSFAKPDFLIKNSEDLYGYSNDIEHKYVFNFSYGTLYYRGSNAYPNIENDIVEKIVLAQFNQADGRNGYQDGDISEWITDENQIKRFIQLAVFSETTEFSKYDDISGQAYIRAVYKNSPISEIIGILIKTLDNKYFLLPSNRENKDNYGIPIDISTYEKLPENCFWNN